MIASNANQYLRPEYLTPLPTTPYNYMPIKPSLEEPTWMYLSGNQLGHYRSNSDTPMLLTNDKSHPIQLDAKKSPLALLAQTCSQIGADCPSKPLLPPIDKSKKADTPRDKSSPSSSSVSSCSPVATKSSFKPYDLGSSRDQDDKSNGRVRTPLKTPTPAQNGIRCSSNQSASSPRASPTSRKTPVVQEIPASLKPETNPLRSSPIKNTDLKSPNSTTNTTGTTTSTTSGFLSGYPGPLPLDVMASSLLTHPLKPGVNPYLSYSRIKTGDGMVPVCRDPYCTGCQLSSHLLGSSAGGKGTCPSGCAQCDGKSGFLPHSSAVAAAYAHAQLAALAAASQLPYVCSWIAGDAAYCGKRFSTSEELLQHLRTHTSDSLMTPPSVLHRTYPTPPLSPLSTARYHPYSKPPLLPPSLSSAFPIHPHPGLPPYFSPYSLYGPRLGASPGMHP